ncbi:MAG TPA: hypothetical protein PKL77_05465 [Candidatus Omnitrophota bacterium]|nr:hypothetical protein [Candidatus Omnitrophota bacterium]HPT07867.1 hypothetical protein [Candidatus Omnitrophota bacterium]
MKKKVLLLVVLVVIAGGACAWGLRAQELSWENVSGELSQVSAVCILLSEPQRILVGSSGRILVRELDQETWRVVESLKGADATVYAFALDSQDNRRICAATSDGLWMSINAGKTWKRIYRGINVRQNTCTSVVIAHDTIVSGTLEGIFRSIDGGRSWQRESGELARVEVVALGLDGAAQNIYLATQNALYTFSMKLQTWQRRFVLSSEDNGRIQEDSDGVLQDDGEKVNRFTSLAVDPYGKNRIVAGTLKGLLESMDGGITWSPISQEGLVERTVGMILFGRGSALYCAAGRSLYEWGDSRWQEIPLDCSGARILALSLGKQKELFVATDKGLFQAVRNQTSVVTSQTIVSRYLEKEPSIQNVQQAAIHYAEVEPEKIMLWRKQAAGRAVLPKVSATIGRDTTDLWHWESGSSTKANDDVLLRGRDSLDWSVGMSWDLSELIWADAQTSIDVRSKLMVELRESVLDEVTKVYFERIRVKAELDTCAIEDRKKMFEKELKLQELTASLDALTGQFFSKQIAKK